MSLGGGGLGTGPLGGMPLGGAGQSVATVLKGDVIKIVRKAFIKRRLGSTGLFESDWFEITDFVQSWGSVSREIDAVRRNRFRHSGVTIVCLNDEGKFNDEFNLSSFWFGYLTRYRTLVKIEGGYEDCFGTEIPADKSLGVFILDKEIPISGARNTISLKCSSLQSVFNEERAVDIAGLGGTASAGAIIATIRDHTDGAGTPIFRQFITSTAWTIQTGSSTNYVLATDTSLDGLSAWDLMEKMAEAEGKVLLINRSGGLEFRTRDPRTTTVAFSFKGQGFNAPNIKKLVSLKEPWDKFFSRVRIQFDPADTSTSFVEAGETTTVNNTSLRWKFGQQTFEFENDFIPTSTVAQTLADSILSDTAANLKEIEFEAFNVPELEVLDRIEVSYRSYSLVGQTLWDQFNWDGANWVAGGENFDLNDKEFTVISKSVMLNDNTMMIKAREI